MFERKILRKIFGPTKEDNGNWRIKTNKEWDVLIKHRNILNYVKAQRLSWFGHINRMPETSIVKKIHKWKAFTGRPVGRPKYRWEDDVRNYLKEMKLIEWTEQVQDRLRWKRIVEKAKTLPEFRLFSNYQLNAHTVRLLTEGDDTRGCGDTIGPPEDEQRAARNMLRSVV